MERIKSTIESGIQFITLNDVENSNRLNKRFIQDFRQTLTSAEKEEQVRGILIRSSAEVFSLGMDLSVAVQGSGDTKNIIDAVTAYGTLLQQIYSCSKPVICLVEGPVKAGGIGIVCACDIVLANTDANFELGEIIFGLIPANVLPYLFGLRVTPQKARYLILTAKNITSQEAKEYGIADEVFAPEAVEKETRKLLKTISRAAPEAIASLKNFTEKFIDASMEIRKELGIQELINLLKNKEVIEGIKAFQSGNLPNWFGKYTSKAPISLQKKE
jgi:enoyl-CoA hydratase/carnithine racemase